VLLALLFEYGVALHDLRLAESFTRKQPLPKLRARASGVLKKAAWQAGRDYALYPLLAGLNAPRVLAGNMLASVMRNLWSFAIIFCGHFPEGVEVFRTDLANEKRGAWYLRQLTGSANIEGGRAFHVASGHLSHQIEHHLFPDVPAARYPEMAPVVREICERYGLRYNTGSFGKQLGSVAKQIVKYSLPVGARN
jgi:fatty acid desaturase